MANTNNNINTQIVLFPMGMNDFKKVIGDVFDSRIEKLSVVKETRVKEVALYTRNEVLDLFSISAPTLRTWTKKMIVPKPIRKGRLLYFLKNEIDNILIKRNNEKR
jgi:predicted DNA-binding transcriptional regulator AlpA